MRLFISYAHADFKKVEQVAEIFEAAGHEVWFDRALAGGDNWWQSILTNIEAADVFVFALTPQSTASQACRAEFQYAVDLNKPILPVMLADAELPMGRLQETQFVNAKALNRQETVLQLSRALFQLRERLAAGDFPKPTPPPPYPKFPFPDDPLHAARGVVQDLRAANNDDLMQLILRLKQITRENPHTLAEARRLVELISQSPNVSQQVALEAKDALRTINRRGHSASSTPAGRSKKAYAGLWAMGAVGILMLIVVAVVVFSGDGDHADNTKESRQSTATGTSSAAGTPSPTTTRTTAATVATTATTAETNPTPTPTQLNIWYPDNEANRDVLWAWANRYMAYFPEVTIILGAIPSDSIKDQIANAIGTADAPDLILGYGDWAMSYAANNQFLPLDELIAETPIRTQVSDSAWSTVAVQGQHFGVPVALETLALYYNRTLVDEVTLPKTVGELVAYATTYSLSADLQNAIMPQLSLFYTAGIYFGLGGRLYDENTGENLWNTDESATRYLDITRDLFMMWAIPVYQERELDTTSFENQRAPFFVDGSWNLAKYQAIYGDNLGVALLPKVDGNSPWRPYVRSKAFFIPAGSENASAARDFLAFVTSPEALVLAATAGDFVPVASNLDGIDPNLMTFAQQADGGLPFPGDKYINPYWDVISRSINAVTIGGTDSATAAAASLEEIVERARQE